MSDLVLRDRRYMWHPYTQMKSAAPQLPIKEAKGAYLIDEEGRKYLDACSSWWVNLHGHSHPHLVDCLTKQAQTLDHIAFVDFTHSPAIELGERLLKLLPSSFSKVYYSDNGSTAVEIAIKMAFQFWYNQETASKKKRLISFKGAYHGDTFGAMSMASHGVFNEPFWPFLFEVVTIDPPAIGNEERSLAQLQEAIQTQEIAGFIFEPHIQGVGGMKIHSLPGLERLIAYCHQNGVLTIADEVMTGFGRTGPLFVSSQLSHPPDIICLAKGLTGGMMPLAATICSERIYEAFFSDDRKKALLHGHSYHGNALACAVALGSLDLLERKACLEQRLSIESCHRSFCQKWKDHPRLIRIDFIGTLLIIEYQSQGGTSYFHSLSRLLTSHFLKEGIAVRPLGNILYLLPPYCINRDELQHIYKTIEMTLENPYDLSIF